MPMEAKKSESYLLFRLQEELFAVSVHQVLEIIETGEEHSITHLPKAPPCINGVVNFRGNVIPVINTRLKFDQEDYNDTEKFVVMVLSLMMNNQELYVGAMSDKVVDVIEIPEEDIKPVPEVGKGYDANYIKGVLHKDNRFIMLLNIEAAIGSDDIVKLKTNQEEVLLSSSDIDKEN
jgi:purine-binding chemotaxis protein CheW